MCGQGSFNAGTLEWEFSAFDPDSLSIASYPATFDLDMTASDNFGSETFAYSVTITAPPCVYAESANPVTSAYSSSTQIDPYEVTDSSGDPACTIIGMSCS